MAMESTPIYVDCQVTNGWNADPASDGGTRWYRVRWPESASKGNYWAYGGYLYPVGSEWGGSHLPVTMCSIYRGLVEQSGNMHPEVGHAS